MGYSCVIPNCKSGYPSEKKKQARYALFRTPQHDVNRLRQWEQNIPRDIKLKSTHRVCEKHFTEESIIRKKIINYNDPSIPNLEVSLAHPYLTETAIPTIFPDCLAYFTDIIMPRKKPTAREPFIKAERIEYEIIGESEPTFQTNSVSSHDQVLDNN